MPIPSLFSVHYQMPFPSPQNTCTPFSFFHETPLAYSFKQHMSRTLTRHKAKLHVMYRYQSSYSVLQQSLHYLHCMLQQLYSSVCPTIHHIPFSFKRNSNTKLSTRYSHIHTSTAAFPNLILLIASITSSSVTPSTGPSTISASTI